MLRLEPLEARLPLATFYVAPTGSDLNPGTSAAPWQTLQKAANTVKAGDTVDVRAGNYAGMDLWTSGAAAAPIVFQGEPGAVVNAPNSRTADGINLEGASYVTIEGFTVRGVPRAGIRAVLDQHVTIRNNVADANGVWGIFTGFSGDLTIENNVASHSVQQHGIYVSNSGDRPIVLNNTVFGNNDSGIQLNADLSQGGDGIISNALIEGNTIYENGHGGGAAINLDGVQDSRIDNNLLYNNHATGIALFQQDGATGSLDNVVVNNTIVEAADSRYALLLFGGSINNTIQNNILYNNSPGRGSIDISSDSLPGLVSDYNVLMDRILVDDTFPQKTLAQWQAATGQDLHSIVATPTQLFVNAAANDYHLTVASPAIDAGTLQNAPAIDLDGKPRPSGPKVDIGAYEFQVAVAGAPAALYHFDETSGTTAADASGSGSGATYVNSPLLGQSGALSSGAAANFNGVNQYVSLPAAPFGSYGSPVSFETWFNAAPGSSGVILSQTGGGASPGGGAPAGYVPVVAIGTDGRLRSSLFWHGDVNARIASTNSYNDGQWHHVAVTYSGGVERLYIDGQQDGQQNGSEVPYAANYSYYLGTGFTTYWAAASGGWSFFQGRLDEAAIYQRELTASEIAQHFAAGNPQPSSTDPSALYHFDESSGTTAADASDSGNAAAFVNGPQLGQSGALATGTAASFNGVNQYVALPAAVFGGYGSAVSFETWFNAAPGTSGVILSQTGGGASPGGGAPAGYVPVVALGTDGHLRSSLFWHGDVNARITSAAAYNDGQWHHVAVTYSGGIERLYVDGQQVGQQSGSEVPYAASYSYYLGTGYTAFWAAGNGGWNFFQGKLDEAAAYQRALSASEIAQHFVAGNPPPVSTAPSALYHFDETSDTAAADSSGAANNATYVNSPLLGQPGALASGTAVSFNGVNQYVALPAAAFGGIGGPMTFETWFKAAPGTSGVILSQSGDGASPLSGAPAGYVPALAIGTDGRLRSSLFWHGDTNARITTAGTYNDGQWHHVAVTYSGGVESLYLDGVLAGQQTAAEFAYAANYSYYLGTGYTALWPAGNGGWSFFQGSLDEAAIYQRALTATEVAQHYSAGTAK